MAVTDYKYPGTVATTAGGGGIDWSNPNDIKVDDNSYSRCRVSDKNFSYILRATNFGFSVPSGSSIDGIEVVVNRNRDAVLGGVLDKIIKIVLSGTEQGSNLSSATEWPTSFADITYGSSTNTWGFSPSQSNVVDSGFGLDLQMQVKSPSADSLGYVDYVKMRVYYTEGGGGSLPLKNVFNRPFRGVFR